MKCSKAFITGLSGPSLTGKEKDYIAVHRPWGFILFNRNIENGPGLYALTHSLREVCARAGYLPQIFVDQEGGRVQRLRPPLAPHYPAAARLGALYRRDRQAGLRAAWLMSRLHAFDLKRFGFSGDCLPVLDIPFAGSHDVIGARAYARDPATVAALGREAMLGLLAGGIVPVMKHIPGHGRAMSDTHKEPARVAASLETLRRSDFVPFRALSSCPCAMVSHVIYEAVDADNPATLSRKVIEGVIRDEIGFDGLLMTDDLAMRALSGSAGERAQQAFTAGCDVVMHCSGRMNEMLSVAENAPWLAGRSLERARAAENAGKAAGQDDEAALRAEFRALPASVMV